MAMKINDEVIEDRFEVWSIRQASSDGKPREIAFDEGEGEARRYQKSFGGTLLKRNGYVSAPQEVAELSDEETLDLV